uniref:FLYWCH-type domain-containing protein n=1 Tax=Octopus bimaculoides TaxID=37653 RepID=A0A0L8HQ62_OCTBM
MLKIDGFIFVKDKQIGTKIYWKCSKFALYCKCCAITNDGEAVKVSNEHNHSGDSVNIKVHIYMNRVKQEAKETCDSPHYIISSAALQLSENIVQALPAISSIKKTIHNVRQKERSGLANPIHRREIVFTDEQTKTNKGKQFLLYDSGPGHDRMLIFTTQNNLRILASSEHLQVDGTFKTVPQLFEQLYTVHAIKNDFIIPIVYALLPDKTADTYRKLFAKITSSVLNLQVTTIMLDFKLATITAVKEFNTALHYGCLFHLGQCLYQKICESGLKVNYDTDSEFAFSI